MSILDNSNAPGSFNAKFAPIDFNTESIDPEAKILARQKIHRINAHLKMPPLDAIDAQFQRMRGKKNHDPTWHQCMEFNSSRDISRDLDPIPGHELFYGAGSKTCTLNPPPPRSPLRMAWLTASPSHADRFVRPQCAPTRLS